MAAEGKTVRIRCSTWDQVEAFYTEKLRGNMLVVKMPFRPGIGESMVVALGLPDGLVFAIDATVVKIGADDAGKVPVALRLGLTPEARTQLDRLVAHGRAGGAPVAPGAPVRSTGTRPPRAPVAEMVPPPVAPRLEDVAEEERAIFVALATTIERLRPLPAHEVLDVPPDADIDTVRAGYAARAARLHPDAYRRYRSPALRALAAEGFAHLRRAFECMEQRPAASGWLVPVGDAAAPTEPLDTGGAPVEPLAGSISSPYSEIHVVEKTTPVTGVPVGPAAVPPLQSAPFQRAAPVQPSYEEEVSFTTSVRMRALTAEELFDEEPTGSGRTPFPQPAPAGSSPQTALAEPGKTTPSAESAGSSSIESGRAAMTDGRWREACVIFASILRNEPRNRQVRALYHVANGMDLRVKGEGVQARLQFETALAHDRECEEARRALAVEPDKKGIFKRLFDR